MGKAMDNQGGDLGRPGRQGKERSREMGRKKLHYKQKGQQPHRLRVGICWVDLRG